MQCPKSLLVIFQVETSMWVSGGEVWLGSEAAVAAAPAGAACLSCSTGVGSDEDDEVWRSPCLSGAVR